MRILFACTLALCAYLFLPKWAICLILAFLIKKAIR